MTNLPFQYLPRHILAALLLLNASPLFAQEDAVELQEVDRILAELNGDAEPAVENDFDQPGTFETTETEESFPETVDLEEIVPEPDEPVATVQPAATDSIPSIRIEETRDVPGLQMTQAQEDDDLISITLDNVRLADVVRIFARSSGANIIIPEGLDEMVSANLNDVDWRQALEVILADKGYVLVQRRPGIFAISRLDQLATEPLTTETLELQFITVETAHEAVRDMVVTSNARVTPLPAANVIIVRETPRQLEEIREILRLIDKPRQQVFIEAKFVELTDEARQDLGIDWQILGDGYTVGIGNMVREYERTSRRSSLDGDALITGQGQGSTSTSTRGLQDNFVDPVTESLQNQSISERSSTRFSTDVRGRNIGSITADGTVDALQVMESEIVRTAVMSAQDFALTLRALQSLNGVRIVSNPKMLVANGQTARIHVGRQEPRIRALPSGDSGTAFVYELDGFIETGVKLEVTPSISTSRNISVNIIPELSRIIGEKSFAEGGTTFPITLSRRIETEFALDSGKTVAIGGLTEGFDREVVRKVPLLGDLPLIGKYLFRYTRTEKLQEEIIIFVSVQIAHTEELDDSSGLPDHSELIHMWLDNEATRRAARQEALDQAAMEATAQ